MQLNSRISKNITKSKHDKETLRASKDKLHPTFESLVDGVTVSDLKGNILQANEATARLHGYDNKAEIIGKNIFDIFIDKKDYASAKNNLKNILENGYSGPIRTPLLSKDGSKFDAELNVTILKDLLGKPAGFIAIVRNITERKRIEEEAIQYRAKMEALRVSEEMKTQLLSMVSHELRSPLALIKGFVNTLLQPDVKWTKEEERDFIKEIDQASDRLIRLVGDLLDMSSLEGGVLKLNRDRYKIHEVLNSIYSTLSKITEQRSLYVETADDLPLVYIDEARIIQVLTNLVENAVKFSENDSYIKIEATRVKDKVIITKQKEKFCRKNQTRVFKRRRSSGWRYRHWFNCSSSCLWWWRN